jgi:hypothetical protein
MAFSEEKEGSSQGRMETRTTPPLSECHFHTLNIHFAVTLPVFVTTL